MEQIIETLQQYLKPGAILIAIILLLYLNSLMFTKMKSVKSTGNALKITISFFLVLIGALIFVLSLPIDKNTKEQILGFLGIIISAGIALSSTTVLGNLIAGIMNNIMDRFRNGDLIEILHLQGRVIEKSIFHTEIQLEDSNFVTIPNLFIATNPVKLTRKTNTVITTSVSLGYDVSRHVIEEALKEAAVSTGLKDPFVYITELGDDAVVYKIHGFLEDSSKYFSTNSNLNGNVMDKLHQKGIEIVSPSFRNQRRVDEKEFIPKQDFKKASGKENIAPEELIFEEAIKAEQIEKKKDYLKEIEEKKEILKDRLKQTKEEGEIEKVTTSMDRMEELKLKIEKNIEEQNKKEQE